MRFILLPILAFIALAASSYGTPSGLNNIPTADTTPQGTFVLQGFTTIGDNRDADFNLGFKTGIDAKVVKFELGAAYHVLPGRGGPITAHGKLAVPFGEGLPTFALGAANITFDNDDRQRAGDEFFYGVLSHDFGWLRVHGGCALQDGEALPFAGVDKTFRVSKTAPPSDGKAVKGEKAVAEPETVWRDILTIRADAIQQRDHSWLYSAGVLVPVCSWFVFETWGNFPDNGDDASLTLKANFVFSF